MKYKQSFYNINLADEGYKDVGVGVIYNTLLGTFSEISNDIDLNNPPKELIESGFIVPFDVDESKEYISKQKSMFQEDYPPYITFVIANMTCNFSCAYCFEKGKHGANMSEETLTDIIAYIRKEIDRNKNLKYLRIKFFGGEPLLRMDIIKKVSEFVIPYCQNKGIDYSAQIITNGYYFTKEVSHLLNTYKVKLAHIAIDGFEEDYISMRNAPKDAFQRVIQNIEDSEVKVVIRINVTKTNKDIICDLIKYLYTLQSVKEKRTSIDIVGVCLYENNEYYDFTDEEWLECRKTYIDTLREFEEPSKMIHLDKVRHLTCGMLGKRSVILCGDRYIYRCDRQLGNTDCIIGTIKDGICEDNAIDKEFRCVVADDECMKCQYLPICGGTGNCKYKYLQMGKPCYLIKNRFRQNMQNYLTYVRKEQVN